MFGVVCKKLHFIKINCENCKFKFVSFCVQDQLGLKIEIQGHLWTRFDVVNPMTVLEMANKLLLEIIFFEVNSIVSIYVKL